VASKLSLYRDRAVGFIDWLGLVRVKTSIGQIEISRRDTVDFRLLNEP
jgi:hypothetical protein